MSRKILSADPDDAEVGPPGQASRPGQPVQAALAEYSQVLAANPDHLRARFQRANVLRDLNHDGAVGEFAALLAHPGSRNSSGTIPTRSGPCTSSPRTIFDRGGPRGHGRRPVGVDYAVSRKTLRGESHYTLARYAVAARAQPAFLRHVADEQTRPMTATPISSSKAIFRPTLCSTACGPGSCHS
ncbi:MAG: hypothetical protein WKF75_08545 [Singulisphaera sp.]